MVKGVSNERSQGTIAENENHGNAGFESSSNKSISRSWLWPLGLAVTSIAGMALVAMRGCWHRRLSWPVRAQGHSYQVCLDCGAKQLFDEERFCSYGPFRYDLNELIAWQRARRRRKISPLEERRPAS